MPYAEACIKEALRIKCATAHAPPCMWELRAQARTQAAAATVTRCVRPRSPIVSTIYRKALQDLELGGHRIPKVAARSKGTCAALWSWHGCSASVSLHCAPQTLVNVQHPINDQNPLQRRSTRQGREQQCAWARVLRGSACAGAGATVLCRARAGPAHPDQHVAGAAERRALCGQGRRRRAPQLLPGALDGGRRAARRRLARPVAPPASASLCCMPCCPDARPRFRDAWQHPGQRWGSCQSAAMLGIPSLVCTFVKALHAGHTVTSVYFLRRTLAVGGC
jgi:hypothetical protein